MIYFNSRISACVKLLTKNIGASNIHLYGKLSGKYQNNVLLIKDIPLKGLCFMYRSCVVWLLMFSVYSASLPLCVGPR